MVLGAISSDPQRGWIIVSLAPGHIAQAIRASLLARAMAATLVGRRASNAATQGRECAVMELGIADDGECAGHEQAAQIAVPLFADTAEPGPTPALVLFGYQPDPGREVTT